MTRIVTTHYRYKPPPRKRKNQGFQDETLWQVHQLNAKTVADDRSKQRRNVTHAFAVIIVMLLALGGLMIWAAWL